MDYSKMTDFEINRAVSMAMLSKSENPSAKYVAINDYCNNPADAWPIITANLMRITPIYGAEVIWLVSRDVHAATDENPLRAAMQVYLQLQEAK